MTEISCITNHFSFIFHDLDRIVNCDSILNSLMSDWYNILALTFDSVSRIHSSQKLYFLPKKYRLTNRADIDDSTVIGKSTGKDLHDATIIEGYPYRLM